MFGSAAHGGDSDVSDLDLLVDPAPDATLFDIGAMRHELRQLLGVKVDVLTPNGLPDSFRDGVLAEAAAVWNRASARPHPALPPSRRTLRGTGRASFSRKREKGFARPQSIAAAWAACARRACALPPRISSSSGNALSETKVMIRKSLA